jgi:hypothetical protein
LAHLAQISKVSYQERALIGVVARSSLYVENRLCGSVIGVRTDQERYRESMMPDVVVVFWRDIPAQVIVGKGRAASKVKLTERFEQAIDRCAMKIGARDADSYLAEWRKAAAYAVDGDQAEVAATEAARLEAEFDAARLKTLIDADGWA